MMKKKMMKLSAATLAAMMTMACAVPAFAYDVTLPDVDGHTYSIYQIFKGDYSKEGTTETLSNITWGKNGKQAEGMRVDDEILEELAELSGTDADKANAIRNRYANMSPYEAYARNVAKGTKLENLPGGYYLIEDTTNTEGKYDAKSLYLIKVVGDEVLTAKTDKPTFDKQVKDELADAQTGHDNGWHETADHEINETFQFRLTAKLPNRENMNLFKSYKVQFNDIMSPEVTFEKVDSVVIKPKAGSEITLSADQYTLSENAVFGEAGITWSITIDDLKAEGLLKDKDIQGAAIEVVYSAHLNETAKINNDYSNKNVGYLKYSNNPNVGADGEMGETPQDTVFVFTYDVDNIKTDADETTGLKDAEFRLYRGDGTTEVELIFDATLGGYRPVRQEKKEADGTVLQAKETGTVMKSSDVEATKGQFKIIGLDAGIYKLQETKAPKGYNLKREPITITITATHVDGVDGNGGEYATTTFTRRNDEGSFTQNIIVNVKGAELPETGGMGTNVLYAVGGLLVFGAGTVLMSKKRSMKR